MKKQKKIPENPVEPFYFEVERCKIKELCMAIGDNNPLFFDTGYARKEGYDDTPAPLTFATVMVFWGHPGLLEKVKEWGINTGKILHAREHYYYFKPVFPGDRIKCTMEIESFRSTSAADIIVLKFVFSRQDEIVLIAKMKLLADSR
ncbi:MAG: MaoC family dehydratase N-terminal domain-containing protein [Spirochaetales bacterium]|nr:MaoC family dehydratase N-terminal domain-containing protein [Spirochaetales bacterium]